jgi:hypothetical protein
MLRELANVGRRRQFRMTMRRWLDPFKVVCDAPQSTASPFPAQLLLSNSMAGLDPAIQGPQVVSFKPARVIQHPLTQPF